MTSDPKVRERSLLSIIQVAALVIFDAVIIWVSVLLAYWARFGGEIGERFLPNAIVVASISAIVFVTVFAVLGLYRQLWRYAGVDALLKLFLGIVFGLAVLVSVNLLLETQGFGRPVPLGVLVLVAVFVGAGSGSLRAFGRLVAYVQTRVVVEGAKPILILGAGDAGALLLRDIENQPGLGLRVVGFLDDDPGKRGRTLRGIPVLGTFEDLQDQVERRGIAEVWMALPSASPEQRRRALDICSAADIPTRITSSIAAASSQYGVSAYRQVEIEDLLGRNPVVLHTESLVDSLNGKVVLVTGAAGSIGSELCRQIICFGPLKLLLMDTDESRLYETYLELTEMDASAPQMCIGDVRNAQKLDALFMREQPDVVLHAAAYKHVPLMELAPDEAVMTNVLGTRNVLHSSLRSGVQQFCLVSTDKAVDPKSIMGLTKCIAEQLMLDVCRQGLSACAVRFGNVLGSRGSVVPLFEEQLRRNGRLRVTHPDVTRYFMTIPEAARLVLQAQAITEGGQIYVLDMGEPVKVVDLARKMIALSGVEAEIEYVGLRPAEKLHEVLTQAHEELLETGFEKIWMLNALIRNPVEFSDWVNELIVAAETDDRQGMKGAFRRLAPHFRGHGMNELPLEGVADARHAQ